MRRLSRGPILAVLFLVAASALCAAPPDAPKKGKGPRLPALPTAPIVPTPMPGPDAAVTLGDGVEFVVDFETECVVSSFPVSRLKVKEHRLKAGQTLILPGRFLEGDKVVAEDREFVGPLFVYRVSVAEDGPCDLMVLPVGGTRADMIVRRIVAKLGPQPPPVPPGPKPDPQPEPEPVKVESVWVIVVEDADAARTIETARALNDPFWQTLKPKHDWRHYLSNSKVAADSGYVAEAAKVGYPAVLIMNAKDGDVLKAFKLSTAADIAAAVKAVSK